GFDLYPDMRSQMYLGIGAERASTDAAVAATAGQVLTWHGAVAETYFYSSSGGRTAAPTDVWPGARPVPYLRSVEDPYDAISPYHQWRKQVLSTVQLATRLGLSGVRDVEAKPSRSGWVRAVLVRTSTGSRTLAAEDFARGLGLRSTFFRVGVLGLQASASSTVYGHGVLLHGLARGLRPGMEARRPGGAWRRVPLRAAV